MSIWTYVYPSCLEQYHRDCPGQIGTFIDGNAYMRVVWRERHAKKIKERAK